MALAWIFDEKFEIFDFGQRWAIVGFAGDDGSL
jgi:hypothetical protein